jgi:phycobilisome core component
MAEVVSDKLAEEGISDTTAVRAPFDHLCRGLAATNVRAR